MTIEPAATVGEGRPAAPAANGFEGAVEVAAVEAKGLSVKGRLLSISVRSQKHYDVWLETVTLGDNL